MTNDRALRLGRGRNVIMCKKLALGFVAATLVCSATVAQEVTLRGVTAFAEKTTYSRGFADAGDCVGKAGPGMYAHKRQFSGRLGIGIGHAGGITFVPCGDEFDTRFHQSV